MQQAGGVSNPVCMNKTISPGNIPETFVIFKALKVFLCGITNEKPGFHAFLWIITVHGRYIPGPARKNAEELNSNSILYDKKILSEVLG